MNSPIFDWIKSHLLIVGAVLIVVIIFLRKMAPQAANAGTNAPMDTSGLQKTASGQPIVYRDVADTFINITKTDTTNTTNNTATTTAAPIEHPIEPYTGILGPGATIDQAHGTYTEAGKTYNLPSDLLHATLIPGAQGRMWVNQKGLQNLLTSGIGPGVLNSGFPVGSPYNTPGAYN